MFWIGQVGERAGRGGGWASEAPREAERMHVSMLVLENGLFRLNLTLASS